MSVFLERIRAALGADYEVLNELASGGMGIVYRARDRTLDRLVAIKIIRPDLATASMCERFLREARVLASFSHPNIVPVHRAGEADGMAYYVMDFLHGETLAERLQRGPLTADEFRMVANDLLAALEVVHEHGVVHRDVKPSNVFMTTGRAVLSDFGISRPSNGEATGLTGSGHIVGTPGYMPPEQLAGSDVTVRTDIAAAAMVLFEACTGTPWSFDSHADDADWSRVPADAAPAIRRALAWSPSDRLASVREFRASLAGRSPPGRRRTVGAVAALAVLTAVVVYAVWPTPPPLVAPFVVGIRRLTGDVGDSVAIRLVNELRASADIAFRLDTGGAASPADISVEGSVDRRGDSTIVRLVARGRGATATFPVRAAALRGAVADSLARPLLLGVWQSQDTSHLGLPREALPGVNGMDAFVHAEALYASNHWTDAREAYEAAERLDSSCALCDLRQMSISRWLRRSPDPAVTARVVAARNRFTPRYQRLVAGIDTNDRWGALDRMIAADPDFELGQFIYGDELFHRGPLAGRDRGDAIVHFQNAIRLRPGFAPTWAHLAWVAIAVGDSATAVRAMATYDQLGAKDDVETLVVSVLLNLGFHWRFMPPDLAIAVTQGTLANSLIATFPDLHLGARYLQVFDAPAGVAWLGREFLRMRKPELRTPGLVAQVVGLLAQGKTDSARAMIGRLRGESATAEYQLVAAEFEAAIVLFDSLDAAAALPRLDSLLAPLTRNGAGTVSQRRRAAWMLALVARRAGNAERARHWTEQLAGETGRRPLATLAAADAVGDVDPGGALSRTATLLQLDSAGAAGDPFFRTALHLMRAHWQERTDSRPAAVGSLLWHENYDLVSHVEGILDAYDVDVAFGTVGRWNRARLLTQSNGREVCRGYADVVRLWGGGDARHRARAVDAGAALKRLGCQAS